MDYAMLSRLQIQSMTDQENYRKLPAILVGVGGCFARAASDLVLSLGEC